VGYDEGGQLTEKVRRKPFSVVLFDEIEKAHPDVFNTLLQILEDGRLTDGQGRIVDFKNTVIILTTNLGTRDVAKAVSLGFQASEDTESNYDRMKVKVNDELKQHFRPEFLNRIDEIIIFQPLTRAQMRSIIDIQLHGLMKRLEERKIRIELSDRAKDLIIEEGYDPTYGARPLKRTLQRQVLDPLAMRVLQGDFREGDTVRVDVSGGKLQFSRVEAAVTA
jgi:ATP-dependent Clp protease ATP-binding subunit ClpC